MTRELVVLGTASQAPTRTRNHNGYLVCWDGDGILFDPGEGTQRQLVYAGRPATRITRICLTHLHGDHCLGLPGVLQRLALDRATTEHASTPVPLHFPASGRPWVERLVDASIGRRQPVRLDPVTAEAALAGAVVAEAPPLRITARPLAHRVDALGWRIEEPPGRRFLPEALAALGIHGPAVGRLEREGVLDVGGRRVTLEQVTAPRPPQSLAVVMDTGVCDAAVELASGVDLLLCEATFLESEVDLAVAYGHLTARQAATIAREAGARLLVLTHLSSRYAEGAGHLAEARAVFPDVVVAEDLDIIPVPPRRPAPPPAAAPSTGGAARA
jgi:ribonuclease Z